MTSIATTIVPTASPAVDKSSVYYIQYQVDGDFPAPRPFDPAEFIRGEMPVDGIQSISKWSADSPVKNLVLYDVDYCALPNLDNLLKNYESLPSMYEPGAVNEVDYQIIQRIQSVLSTASAETELNGLNGLNGSTLDSYHSTGVRERNDSN